MVQVEIPNILMKEVIKVAEEDPIYKTLDLDSKKSYVKEVLKDFVKTKGGFNRQVFREEIDRFLIAREVANNAGTQH